MYTVKQLSELAGVSVRTLHYYDEMGLLKPSSVGENSYRYYDDASLLRLQQKFRLNLPARCKFPMLLMENSTSPWF